MERTERYYVCHTAIDGCKVRRLCATRASAMSYIDHIRNHYGSRAETPTLVVVRRKA